MQGLNIKNILEISPAGDGSKSAAALSKGVSSGAFDRFKLFQLFLPRCQNTGSKVQEKQTNGETDPDSSDS